MNKIILTLLTAFLAIGSGFAQYFDGKPVGTAYIYEVTTPMTAPIKVTQTLKSVEGNKYTFHVVSPIPGLPKPLEMNSVYTVKDNKVFLDPTNVTEVFKSSMGGNVDNIDLEGDPGYFPLQGKVGDKFTPYSYKVVLSMMGMGMNITSKVTSFEITREEEVTTPLGTFKAFVVEVTSNTSVDAMGQKQDTPSNFTYWIVPGKGPVKQSQTTQGVTSITTLVEIK